MKIFVPKLFFPTFLSVVPWLSTPRCVRLFQRGGYTERQERERDRDIDRREVRPRERIWVHIQNLGLCPAGRRGGGRRSLLVQSYCSVYQNIPPNRQDANMIQTHQHTTRTRTFSGCISAIFARLHVVKGDLITLSVNLGFVKTWTGSLVNHHSHSHSHSHCHCHSPSHSQ